MSQTTFTAGHPVYSKRCGGVGGFDGVVMAARGDGYQILDPKTGATFQRDPWDLIGLSKTGPAESKTAESVI